MANRNDHNDDYDDDETMISCRLDRLFSEWVVVVCVHVSVFVYLSRKANVDRAKSKKLKSIQAYRASYLLVNDRLRPNRCCGIPIKRMGELSGQCVEHMQ